MMDPTTPPAGRPDPIVTADAAFFWEGAKRGQLLALRCLGCGELQHPPRPMCPRCHSVQQEPTPLSGRGKVSSWIMPRHPPPVGFARPPVVVLVELEEGIRLVSNLVDTVDGHVALGMEVEVRFEPTVGGFAVPVFRPRNG